MGVFSVSPPLGCAEEFRFDGISFVSSLLLFPVLQDPPGKQEPASSYGVVLPYFAFRSLKIDVY